ncbi:MAG: acyloxyacyl hydrolase [Rhodomicrobium sp.]
MPAVAADLYAPPAAEPFSLPTIEPYAPSGLPFWTISEVRVGALDHALEDSPREKGSAVNFEVLGSRFAGNYENSVLDFLLTPRPVLGTTYAFGKTDEFYWGVAWDAKLFHRTFLEGEFGGAAHDGPIDTPGLPAYGCELNFHESLSLGYEIAPRWRVLATIDHMSNGNLCHPNHGLSNAGIRLGYLF